LAEESGLDIQFDPATLDLTPRGISGLYSLSADEHVLALLKTFDADPAARRGGWLVSGHSLDALTAIQGLLEMGVNAARIHWLQPLASRATDGNRVAGVPASPSLLSRTPQHTQESTQADPLILPRALSALAALGVRVHSGKRIKAVRQTESRRRCSARSRQQTD
jgi:hypothetical protein